MQVRNETHVATCALYKRRYRVIDVQTVDHMDSKRGVSVSPKCGSRPEPWSREHRVSPSQLPYLRARGLVRDNELFLAPDPDRR